MMTFAIESLAHLKTIPELLNVILWKQKKVTSSNITLYTLTLVFTHFSVSLF